MTKDPGLVLVAVRHEESGNYLPDAFGCYIGRHSPVEVPEGVSWRDALAGEMARANALEDVLESLGYDVSYFETVSQLAEEADGIETLCVNGEPWDLPE